MHISTKFCAFAAAAFLAVAGATAATPQAGHVDLTKFVYKAKSSHSAFESPRALQIASANAKMMRGDAVKYKATAEDPYKATRTLGPTSTWGDLDGPNGELWFYSMDYDYDAIVMNEYWTDYILKSFVLNIYDGEFKIVATIKDDLDYAEDEVRSPYFDLLPVLTKNFFNDDDKYEVIMGLAMNTTTPGINRYSSLIYQIDGEKDADGNDKIIYKLPELVSDVLDASVDGKEQFYMTVMGEYFPDYDPDEIFGSLGEEAPEPGSSEAENSLYWQTLSKSRITVTTYSGVDSEGNLVPVISHAIPHQNLPGDQESAAFTLTKMVGNDPVIVFQQYKDSFFLPYASYDAELIQRPDNSLELDIYTLAPGKAELRQHTSIPFTLDKTLVAQFYAVGNFSYRNDINYTDYNSGDKAAFIVQRQDKAGLADESYPSTYIVYNPDGTEQFTIFEGAESALSMSDVPGFAPQYMFVTLEGVYYFHFVNILTGEEENTFSYVLEIDGDNDPVTSNLDRVPYGDSYAYVGELSAPLEADDYTYVRIVWMDKKGEPLFVDELNAGTAVHYAQSYISAATLKPDVFHSDSKREYMLLIKRGNENGGTTEDLLIAQPCDEENPEGKDILLLTADERGALRNIAPYSEVGVSKLVITYYDRIEGIDSYCVDVYDLPFDDPNYNNGVDAPEAISNANITFNGIEISAPGEHIDLYNLQGILVKAGNERLSTASLPAGAYIAKTSQGALKFIKK